MTDEHDDSKYDTPIQVEADKALTIIVDRVVRAGIHNDLEPSEGWHWSDTEDKLLELMRELADATGSLDASFEFMERARDIFREEFGFES